jgi:hypothetical protein
MDWKQRLRNNREQVLALWEESALDLYPAETVRFLKREKDRFQNPVGHATHQALDTLLRGMAEGKTPSEMKEAVDKIMRVRAVQDFSPAQALAFVFALRRFVREVADETTPAGFDDLDAYVDRLALVAFDSYLNCREKLYELRASESRRHTASLLKRLESLSGGPERPDGPTEGKDPPKGGCGA